VTPSWGCHRLVLHQPSPRTMFTTAGFQRI
jgi:hypothetical protein